MNQDLLKQLLHYDPETGYFTWEPRAKELFKTTRAFKVWNTLYARNTAGCKQTCGRSTYIVISLFKHQHKAHRLAFLYMTGEFPLDDIDHIDHDGENNAWLNIRAVTHQENLRNRRKSLNNTSGHTGVSWHKPTQKWRARIMADGREKNLGVFINLADAIIARKTASIQNNFHESTYL